MILIKRLLYVILFFESTINLSAQLVYTTPSFPSEYDELIISFNSSLGNKGLLNYSGDI